MQREHIQLIFKRYISELKRKFSFNFTQTFPEIPHIYCINVHRTHLSRRNVSSIRFSAAILSTWGNNTAITPGSIFALKLPESLPWRSKLFLHRESGAVWSLKESGTHDECASACPRACMCMTVWCTDPRFNKFNDTEKWPGQLFSFYCRESHWNVSSAERCLSIPTAKGSHRSWMHLEWQSGLLLFPVRVGVSSLSLDFLARLSADVKYL